MATETSKDQGSRSSTATTTEVTTRRRGTAWINANSAGKPGWPVSRLPLAACLLGGAAVVGLGTIYGVDRVQDKLEAATISELEDRYGVDVSADDVDFDFRDGEVTLRLPEGTATEEDVEAFLASRLDGSDGRTNLRVVDVTIENVASEAPEGQPLDVSVESDGSTITLTGDVLDQAQSDRLQAAAEEAVGADNVVNNLRILDAPAAVDGADDRVAGLAAAVALMGPDRVESASAQLDDTTLTVTGVALTDAAQGDLEGVLNGADGVTASANLSVLAAPPPSTTTTAAPPATTEPAATLEQETVALQEELDALQAEIIENVVFDVNSSEITDRAATTLDKVVDAMNRYSLPSVLVGGHTDADGNDQSNLELSDARAKSVASYLAAGGIDADRVRGEGFGETQPVAPNDSRANKQKNRRVEFTAVGEFSN